MHSISICVKGRVQGVGFRYSTLYKAKELGLSGFVKNQSDGSVYIEATGPSHLLQEFEHWCAQGPSRARVDDLQREEIERTHTGTFCIR